jgi:hypothetical protein
MSEDWRVTVVLPEEHHGHLFTGFLRGHKLEDELAERLRGRVVVSHDDDHFFLYAESREQAEAAIEVVEKFLAEHEIETDVELTRWHDIEERWADPSEPLPETPEDIAVEQQRRTELERQESKEDGVDDFEVQVVLPDHKSTVEFAERLKGEGLDVSRRWRFLVISMPSEEDAEKLADRIRAEAPPEAKVSVALAYGRVIADMPYSGFSSFGGMGV